MVRFSVLRRQERPERGTLQEQPLDFGFVVMKFPDDVLELRLGNAKNGFDIEWYENLQFFQGSVLDVLRGFCTQGCSVNDCNESGMLERREVQRMVVADRLDELGRQLPSFRHPGTNFAVIGLKYPPLRVNERVLFTLH